MAQLKEGSIIKKITGDEVIATLNDIPEIPSIPTKTSELTNDSGFLTSLPTHTHDDNYYTETEIDAKLLNKAEVIHDHNISYYTKTEVDAMIGDIESILDSINGEVL